ncbi:MAG: hypothetical protein RL302_697 [Pseudomonadota bacterium]|jgi:Protein of unknown function (DUF3619)
MTTHSVGTPQNFEDAMGRAVALRLTESMDSLPHDITERLKAARMQALGKRKIVKTEVASSASVSGGTLTLQGGHEKHGLWNWIGSLLPLVALIAGLVLINLAQDGIRANEIAEVDAELLTGDLPTTAYTDPGFAQYLRASQQRE